MPLFQRHMSYIASEWGPDDFAAQKRAIEKYKRFCLVYAEAGGPLVTGTDMSFGGIYLQREIQHFVAAGLTPLQAIRAGTRAASSALGRDDLGQITPGRTADLILVAGDPTTNISALRVVERTIVAGRTVWQRTAVAAAAAS
jgi:imidazolonepropionase-like amidohydrolase